MWGIYYIYYILGIVLLPGLILGIWAQAKVTSTFNKFNKIETKHGLSSDKVARFLLDSAGYTDTNIKHIKGELTDNFNPTTNTVSLSDSVYNKNTIGAVGVTAHEIGHVFQHKSKYPAIKLRNALVPVLNFTGWLVWPLIVIGLVMEIFFYTTAANWFIYIGIGLYALNTVFCLITLPIEINASKRAYKMLVSTGEMDTEEAEGVKQVLSAAAWTYVASLVTSILSLVRLILLVFISRRRD